MSRQNVEPLERFYEAFNADNFDPWLAFADPEFVYRTRDELPGGWCYRLEAALDRISELRELFDELRWEPQEFIDAGEHTVSVVRQIARGRASGVMIDESIVHVWLIQGGRAKELRVYSQRSEALEAVGLRQ
jgi:ketosteroid isomerase-like protein